MINHGKYPILGVNVHAVDYAYSVDRILAAAHRREPYAVSALAVHGVMTGFLDGVHRRRLNGLDLVVPDGQPVRWALGWLHRVRLSDRVYGPNLMYRVVEGAARAHLPIYLYGSTARTLDRLRLHLQQRVPGLLIAGAEPSRFRRISEEEKQQVVERVAASGARIVFVGLGCPRQEAWVFEYRARLSMPLLAVGAAFDFHAGTLSQAPPWMQRRGLEWLFRLVHEPRRLWRRYLVLSPVYLAHVGMEKVSRRRTAVLMPDGAEPEERFG